MVNVEGFAYLLVFLTLITVLGFCEGGLTSSYTRKNGLSRDMPLDSDVFREPPGYNSPQQVKYEALFTSLQNSMYFVLPCFLGEKNKKQKMEIVVQCAEVVI